MYERGNIDGVNLLAPFTGFLVVGTIAFILYMFLGPFITICSYVGLNIIIWALVPIGIIYLVNRTIAVGIAKKIGGEDD